MIRKKILCIQISEQALSFFIISKQKSHLTIINEQIIALPLHCIYENRFFNLDTLTTSINTYLARMKLYEPLTIISIPHLSTTPPHDENFTILQSLISIKKVPIVLKILTAQPITSYRDSKNNTSNLSYALFDPEHNLLNPYIKHMNRSPRPWLTTTILAAGTLVIGLSTLTLLTHTISTKLQEENKQLAVRTQELQEKTHALRQVALQKNEDQKKIVIIEALSKNQKHLVHLLETVAQTIPNQTMITHFHFKKNSENKTCQLFTIDGITLHAEEVLTFIQKLTQAEPLYDITLTKISSAINHKKKPYDQYHFQLQGTCKT